LFSQAFNTLFRNVNVLRIGLPLEEYTARTSLESTSIPIYLDYHLVHSHQPPKTLGRPVYLGEFIGPQTRRGTRYIQSISAIQHMLIPATKTKHLKNPPATTPYFTPLPNILHT
jgi:hypothetical protein